MKLKNSTKAMADRLMSSISSGNDLTAKQSLFVIFVMFFPAVPGLAYIAIKLGSAETLEAFFFLLSSAVGIIAGAGVLAKTFKTKVRPPDHSTLGPLEDVRETTFTEATQTIEITTSTKTLDMHGPGERKRTTEVIISTKTTELHKTGGPALEKTNQDIPDFDVATALFNISGIFLYIIILFYFLRGPCGWPVGIGYFGVTAPALLSIIILRRKDRSASQKNSIVIISSILLFVLSVGGVSFLIWLGWDIEACFQVMPVLPTRQ